MFILRRRRWPTDVLIVGLHAASREAPHGAAPRCGLLSNSSHDQMWRGEKKISHFQYFMSFEYICNSHQRCFADESGWKVFWTLSDVFIHLIFFGKRDKKIRCSVDVCWFFFLPRLTNLKHFCINTLKGSWKACYEMLYIRFSLVLDHVFLLLYMFLEIRGYRLPKPPPDSCFLSAPPVCRTLIRHQLQCYKCSMNIVTCLLGCCWKVRGHSRETTFCECCR